MAISLIISCLSQKGGVGKSTLAHMIARTYALSGWDVKIADLNTKQKTSVDWVAERLTNGIEPHIAAEPFLSADKALQSDCDLLVIDGRPDSDPSSLTAAKASDLVVIPSKPTLVDLRPQVLFAHELCARGIERKRILFVLNQCSDATTVPAAESRTYIAGAGYNVADTDLLHKVGYQMAQNMGKSISESAFQSLNDRADALAAEIVNAATNLTRRKVS